MHLRVSGVIDHWAYTEKCLGTKKHLQIGSIQTFDYANALYELRTGGVSAYTHEPVPPNLTNKLLELEG